MDIVYVISNLAVSLDALFEVSYQCGMDNPVISIPGNGVQVAVDADFYDKTEVQLVSSEYVTGVVSSRITVQETISSCDGDEYEIRKAVINGRNITYILDERGLAL